MNPRSFKIPRSVLVVIYTRQWDVLLLRRRQDAPDGAPFWQSVTGSQDPQDTDWGATAAREVQEETGIVCEQDSGGARLDDWGLENIYPIYPEWRHRYAPGVFFNCEHLFGLCLSASVSVRLSPTEHVAQCWLPWQQAADHCYSASNAEAILCLPDMHAAVSRSEGSCQSSG